MDCAQLDPPVIDENESPITLKENDATAKKELSSIMEKKES